MNAARQGAYRVCPRRCTSSESRQRSSRKLHVSLDREAKTEVLYAVSRSRATIIAARSRHLRSIRRRFDACAVQDSQRCRSRVDKKQRRKANRRAMNLTVRWIWRLQFNECSTTGRTLPCGGCQCLATHSALPRSCRNCVGLTFDSNDVSVDAIAPEWILLVANDAGIVARSRGSTTAGADKAGVAGKRRHLRLPQDLRGPAGILSRSAATGSKVSKEAAAIHLFYEAENDS